MRKCRKLLAVLLCLVMCLSLLPAAAFAEGEPAEDIVLEEEPVTEEPVEEEEAAEEIAEEDELAAEEAAETFDDADRTGGDDTLLEELETAIADENVHSFDLSNLGEFVISKDLAVYGGMTLNTFGTTVVIPEGVTVTVRDYFGLENLRLDGGMIVEEGHVSVFWDLVLNGEMTLRRSSADLPAEAFSDAVFDRVDLSEDGHISLQYAAQESEEEILSALEAAQALPERYDGCVQVLFPWTLSRDLTLDEKVGLVLEGAWNEGSLEIPADTSLTVDSYLVSVGSPVRVHGMLVNNRELRLDADDGAANPSVGSLELDRGSYSGPGSIYVLSTENPEDYLQGLDLSAFESRIEGDIWTVYTNENAVFEDFKKACSEASEENPIHYTRLSDRGAFTIPQSITVPKGLFVDVWNTVVTVPNGVTLTVCGEFTAGDLVVEEGGEVVLEEECNLWIDSSLQLEGSFRIANNTWPGIPADCWDQSMTEHLSFGGKDAGIKLNIRARSEEDILSAPERYPIQPHVRPSIGVEFAWCLSGDFAFPEGVEIHINGDHGASLTVPSGLRFENGGGYLGLHRGAAMTAAGTLVNNGFVDVQREDNQASRIVMDGGAYEGDGEICVRGAADREEAEGLLGGLTELGYFRVEERDDGIYFRMTDPDWSFADLQEACGKTYEPDSRIVIPNEDPFTIEDDLTIPQNLNVHMERAEVVVPEGVTLTVVGSFDCGRLTVDGSLILSDGGYMNVWDDRLDGKGTITVEQDSHMDVNTFAWQDGAWLGHIDFAGDAWLAVWYDVRDPEEALAAIADTPAMNEHVFRSLNVMFDWTPADDLAIPENMWMEIRGQEGAALTIPAGVTLTMNNAMRVQGADVSVLGTLVNECRLEVYWDDEHRRLGKVSVESGGKYAGDGDIWVETLDKPEACLPGLDLSAYESREEDGGTLFYDESALFAALKAAMADGEDYTLRGGIELVIPENLTIPAGAGLHFWGSTIVVPDGVTLTVEGFTGGDRLAVGGTVKIQGGDLNVHGLAFTEASARMAMDGGWAYIPIQDLTEELRSHVTLANDCCLNLCMIAQDLSQLIEECVPMIGEPEPYVRYWITILFPYMAESEKAIELNVPENVALEIVNGKSENENGSITIGKNVTYQVDGQLFFYGATLTIEGSLINNNWISLNGDPNDGYGFGSIAFEKDAVYNGEGTIWVAPQPNPISRLGRMTEAYTFSSEPADDGGTMYWKSGEKETVSFQTTLNMADFTGIYVYVGLPEGADASQYTIETTGGSYRKPYAKNPVGVSTLPKGSGARADMYRFEAAQFGSPEMTDEVTVTVKKNGEVVKEQSFSIKTVAEEFLASGLTQDQIYLVKGLQQYGYYGHIMFKNPLPLNPVIDGAPALTAIPSSFAPKNDPTGFGAYVTNFRDALDLDARIAMNLYFTLADGYSMNDFSFSVKDKNGSEYTNVTITEDNGNRVLVKIGGISSPQMDDDFTVTMTLKSDTTKTATWTRSVITCAYTGSARTSGDGVKFLQALYQYYVYANRQWPWV